jgi:hypothetical protein
MKLRPSVFVFLLFLVSPVSFGDDLDRSNELFNKSYSTLIESTQYLEMSPDLAWSFVQGSISWDYSIQEQTKILVFSKSKLEEFDRLLERYSSLDLSDTYAVKHRSAMLEYLYSFRSILIDMIADSDVVLLATESRDLARLTQASINVGWHLIRLMEEENDLNSKKTYSTETWEPVRWLNMSIAAGNKIMININKTIAGIAFPDASNASSRDDLFQLLESAERNLRLYGQRITVGRDKARGLVTYAEEHPEIMERYGTLSTIGKVADSYIASFDDEAILRDGMEEVVELLQRIMRDGNTQPDETLRILQTFNLKKKLIVKRRRELAEHRAELWSD